ncbi:MAG: fumarylacetoacetate hydrolase family protein [Gammaproteobacteria bacterium]|nr:fumarylacetoacetate hydrolase family protein [Gammaproteobacteria bacterium]
MYKHRWSDGSEINLPIGKAVCIGRNYAEHAKELGNPVPSTPLLFIKPATALVPMEAPFSIPSGLGQVHHEAEIAMLITEKITKGDPEATIRAIGGVAASLDLTLRDLQSELKSKGHPWEKAKAFDGSCPISRFQPIEHFPDLSDISVSLTINGSVRQQGNSVQMICPILKLVQNIVEFFTLLPGDVVLTGTPAGVSEICSGDEIEMTVGDRISVRSRVTQ